MKPTDDTIALVAHLLASRWLSVDELRWGIQHMGFEMPSTQWVSARLTRMVNETRPRFERGDGEYRLTSYALTSLSNAWPGFRAGGEGR